MTPPFSIWARPDFTVKFGGGEVEEVELEGVGLAVVEVLVLVLEESLIAIVMGSDERGIGCGGL